MGKIKIQLDDPDASSMCMTYFFKRQKFGILQLVMVMVDEPMANDKGIRKLKWIIQET